MSVRTLFASLAVAMLAGCVAPAEGYAPAEGEESADDVAEGAQAVQLPLFSVRAEAGAAYSSATPVEYKSTPGAEATNFKAGWNGGSVGEGWSSSGIGRLTASAWIEQPTGDPKITFGGVNSSARATFSDYITVGGPPGGDVAVNFTVIPGGTATKVGQIGSTASQMAIQFHASNGVQSGTANITQTAGAPATGNGSFTLVVPSGSRLLVRGNASASTGTAARNGSPVSTTAEASAMGTYVIEASAPWTSDSGHTYTGATP